MIIKKFCNTMYMVLNRPAMFKLHRIENIDSLITGYILASSKEEAQIINEFCINLELFISKKLGFRKHINYIRAIRFYSSTDVNTVEYYKIHFEDFCKKQKIELDESDFIH